MYVNWETNILTFSNKDTIILLDAANEKKDGITYTSPELYEYLGFSVAIDDTGKKLTVTPAESSVKTSSDLPADFSASKAIDKIIYVTDPDCSSCKEISILLEKFQDKYSLEIITIDSSAENNTSIINTYYEESNVAEELKGIYPILFAGNQYLFYKEITESNLEKLLQGEIITHEIVKSSPPENILSENQAGTEELTVIYFYSTTCASCRTVISYLHEMEEKYPFLNLTLYNLYEAENISLLKAYGKQYGVSTLKSGEIPAVFLSDTYLIGEEDILDNLEDSILNYNRGVPTFVLDRSSVRNQETTLKAMAIFGAGLLNGVNPCSLSMYLFLMSLLMTDKKRVLRMGLAFALGKLLMFVLMGTIFYQLAAVLDIGIVNQVTKTVIIVCVLLLAYFNLRDFFMAKEENYDKIVLKLPVRVKDMNHKFMRASANYMEKSYILIIMVLLGMVLAFGKFLCSGQIYLTSILLLIQENTLKVKPVFYLLLYSFAFVIPLIILTVLICLSGKVLRFSELLLNNLPAIKFISSILFITFGIYLVFIL